tara:strand:- start:248 stop:646 length:399 start_codon:yes stop_codon:yes gene_type:complete
MAYYALLDKDNIVTKVITGKDENEVDYNLEEVYENMFSQVCKRTSYNTRGGKHYTNTELSKDQKKSFRKNFAAVGYTYNEEIDGFVPPKHFNSWKLDKKTGLWVPPKKMPKNKFCEWDEKNQKWINCKNINK